MLTVAAERARAWLVQGPLQLDPTQVRHLRTVVVERLSDATPTPLAGAMTAVRRLGAAALVVVSVFFLLKDGPRHVALGPVVDAVRVPPRNARSRRGCLGRPHRLVRGTLAVATIDAVLIGTALLLLGVPLWLSLTV